MASKWLRAYDFRVPTAQAPIHVWSTRALSGITADPFEGHRFASFGDDAVIRVWDLRRPTEPVLSFSDHNAAGAQSVFTPFNQWASPNPQPAAPERRQGPPSLVGLEWSPSRRGLLASAEREGRSVRLWHLISPDPSPGQPATQGLLVDTDPERSMSFTAPILAKDTLAPSLSRAPASFALANPHPERPHSVHIVAVSREGGNLEIVEARPPPTLAWSPTGLLSVSRPTATPHRVSVLGTEAAFEQGSSAAERARRVSLSVDDMGDDGYDRGGWDPIEVDVSVQMRRRVNAGYGVDVRAFPQTRERSN
jgi:hypothetical protein